MIEFEYMIDCQHAVNQVSVVHTQHVNEVSLVETQH